jgi:hypothetical protein
MARPYDPAFRVASARTSSRCGTADAHRGWIAGALLALVTVFGAGCAAETADSGQEPVLVDVETDTSTPTIYGGDKDDDEAALSGVVALRVGAGSSFELCTGALVAPNVVLTARHCVTKNTTTSVSCDENGRSANGPHVVGDEAPTTIGVFTGSAPSFAKKPAALGRAIVAPQGEYLCDADIALVVLDRALAVTPLAVRLENKAQVGETIRTVGYGQNDKNAPIGTRFRRGDVKVLGQGQGLSASKTPLGPREFEVGKSICQGDSGGPAISEATGAVIGVVSRGGKCDEDFGHIYTTTAGFASMFEQAFQIAGGGPQIESKAQLQSLLTTVGTQPSLASGEPEAGSCSVGYRTAGRGGSPLVAGFGAAVLALVLGRSRARRRVR